MSFKQEPPPPRCRTVATIGETKKEEFARVQNCVEAYSTRQKEKKTPVIVISAPRFDDCYRRVMSHIQGALGGAEVSEVAK